MARVRLVGVAIKVVADGEAVGQGLVIGRDVNARERLALFVLHGHVAPQTGQRGVAGHLRPLAEHLVERAVLLDDEHHVLDRTGAQAAGGGQRASGRRRPPRAGGRYCPRLARVYSDSRCAIGHRHARNSPCMMSPGCEPRGGATKSRPPLGPEPTPLALATNSSRPSRETAHERAKPARRNVARQFSLACVDDGHGVQARAGHVQLRFVGAQVESEGQHSAQIFSSPGTFNSIWPTISFVATSMTEIVSFVAFET